MELKNLLQTIENLLGLVKETVTDDSHYLHRDIATALTNAHADVSSELAAVNTAIDTGAVVPVLAAATSTSATQTVAETAPAEITPEVAETVAAEAAPVVTEAAASEPAHATSEAAPVTEPVAEQTPAVPL
ncbi:hypothetical protein ACPRNU_12605 [Chromobacterium vaccinii]|uniref:hypothetical protein n=1 Tax=Chromobacterium vaccinii TaxID=1108595 RepID=UPI003C79260A